MNTRHRNAPGNGYWTNSMSRMDQAAASRISPEGSMRGHLNISEFRNSKRGGFGRGSHFRQFQQPMLPLHETDIFMEAGRLAAEYLVSKGMLPPIALSGMWRNGGLKNHLGEYQGFRLHNIDNPEVSMHGRASAHARLGKASLDVGSVRIRYPIDRYSLGSRDSKRERRRSTSFKKNGSERNRELVKSESCGEQKSRDADGGTQTLSSHELARDGVTEVHPEPDSENPNPMEVITTSSSSSVSEKYLTSEGKEESNKGSDDTHGLNAEAQVIHEGNNDAALSKNLDENVVSTTASEYTSSREQIVDLVKHFNFAKVPSRPRSSLKIKRSKADQVPINREESIIEKGLCVVSVVHVIDTPHEGSTCNSSVHQIHELNGLDTRVEKTPVVIKELEVTCKTSPAECSKSSPSHERSLCKEVGEMDEVLSVFGCSNSMFIDRSSKRLKEDDANSREEFKKNREWRSTDTESSTCLPFSSSMEIQLTSEEARASECIRASSSPDEKSSKTLQSPAIHGKSYELTEKKQLSPGSFKTCDLNLIVTCDNHENHDGEQLLNFSSNIRTGNELENHDVRLSISNSYDVPYKNAKVGANNYEVEIIDLDNDSAPEDQTFSPSERRPGSVFTDLDGFPNNARHVNVIHDVQDGYGLMFSELLGHESPNCSVPTDLNSLHNALGLPNAEGILGDDDSIYMSLGEIPISFLGTWDQPTQDYGKPF